MIYKGEIVEKNKEEVITLSCRILAYMKEKGFRVTSHDVYCALHVKDESLLKQALVHCCQNGGLNEIAVDLFQLRDFKVASITSLFVRTKTTLVSSPVTAERQLPSQVVESQGLPSRAVLDLMRPELSRIRKKKVVHKPPVQKKRARKKSVRREVVLKTKKPSLKEGCKTSLVVPLLPAKLNFTHIDALCEVIGRLILEQSEVEPWQVKKFVTSSDNFTALDDTVYAAIQRLVDEGAIRRNTSNVLSVG